VQARLRPTRRNGAPPELGDMEMAPQPVPVAPPVFPGWPVAPPVQLAPQHLPPAIGVHDVEIRKLELQLEMKKMEVAADERRYQWERDVEERRQQQKRDDAERDARVNREFDRERDERKQLFELQMLAHKTPAAAVSEANDPVNNLEKLVTLKEKLSKHGLFDGESQKTWEKALEVVLGALGPIATKAMDTMNSKWRADAAQAAAHQAYAHLEASRVQSAAIGATPASDSGSVASSVAPPPPMSPPSSATGAIDAPSAPETIVRGFGPPFDATKFAGDDHDEEIDEDQPCPELKADGTVCGALGECEHFDAPK